LGQPAYGQDEAGTFDRLRAHRKELFEPGIEKHHGRIFKVMGDGLLSRVVDAVECATVPSNGSKLEGRGAFRVTLDGVQRVDLLCHCDTRR
jgi:class 3 adenylate cyclase